MALTTDVWQYPTVSGQVMPARDSYPTDFRFGDKHFTGKEIEELLTKLQMIISKDYPELQI